MAVPKQRHTKSRRNKGRMHIFLETPTLTGCKKCGKFVLAHSACPNCGFYKGKEVIDVMKNLTKKEKKKKEREIQEKKKTDGKEKSLNMESLSKK